MLRKEGSSTLPRVLGSPDGGWLPRGIVSRTVPLRSKILVVEDDDDLREAVAASIAQFGVDVEQARDGLEGLERLAGGVSPPSAILLDMLMPRLDGAGFLAAMRAQPHLAHIPVITMTGGQAPAPEPPITSRLDKPFDIDELARILVSLCEN